MNWRLPHSRDSDIAVNRDGRMTGRQIASLWFAGLVRAILGIPLVVVPAVVIWLIPTPALFTMGELLSDPVQSFLFIAVMIAVLFCGVYISFTAFPFVGDAITANVSYVTGQLERHVGTGYRGRPLYFMVLGPVRTAVRKKTFDALPVGVFCHAYYASGSMYLLSLEPTTAEAPHPSRPFGDDPTHAWNRLRSSWLVPGVAAFGLAAGVHEMIVAHPAHTFTGDLYLHPEHQYWGMIASGAAIAILSGAGGSVYAWWTIWRPKRRARDQTEESLPPSI